MMSQAQETAVVVDSGHTAWLLAATVLVLFMTMPGLALFYGGLVRARNVLSVMTQCAGIACMASLLWVAGLYSLAFKGGGAWIGNWDAVFHLSAVATLVIAQLVKATLGLRVTSDQEYDGMDLTEHGEDAYPMEP